MTNAVRERSRQRKGQKKSKPEQGRKLEIGKDIPSPSEMGAILQAAGPTAKPLFMVTALAFAGQRIESVAMAACRF
jgi:hypothetical protein